MGVVLPAAVWVGKALIGVGVSKFWNFVGTTVSSLLIGSAVSKVQQRLSADRRGTLQWDFGNNITDPIAALPVVYGTMRVPVQIVYGKTTDDQLYLWVVAAIAHGPIYSVDSVYLDGQLVFGSAGRPASVVIGGKTFVFSSYAHMWKAYGTESQYTVTENAVGAKTITNTAIGANRFLWTFTTSAAHGYSVGDIVKITGITGLSDTTGYGIVTVGSSTTFTVEVPEGAALTDNSGTVDHYTPDLDSIFGSDWSTSHRGQGVAYLVFRFRFNNDRFPNGLPRIEAVIKGIAAKDTRSDAALTISSYASGAAVTGLASTLEVTTSTNHGYAEGDIVRISGCANAVLNGIHRVDRVVDSDTFRIHTVFASGSPTGTVEKLVHSSNPAVVIRDYLTNRVYGASIPEAAIDDTAMEAEANFYDEDVQVPIENTSSFTNLRSISGATGDGTRVTFTTTVAHGYLSTDSVRIDGFSDADNLDGIYDIDDVPSSTTFRILLARSGSWTPETVTVYDKHGVAGTSSFGTAASLKTQNRFECHGVVDTGQSVKSNLEALLTSCRGRLIHSAGSYRVSTRRVKAAESLILSEANIVGDWEGAGPGVQELVNIVVATYPNAVAGYALDQVEWPGPNLYNGFLVDDNGLRIIRHLELPFTTNKATAQQIAMVARREARNPLRISVTCHEAAMVLAVDDVVQVTHETPGFSLKKFWVDAIGILPDGHVRLMLVEYEATSYDYNAQDDTPFAPDTSLVSASTTRMVRLPARAFSILGSNVTQGTDGISCNSGLSGSALGTWPFARPIRVVGFRIRAYKDNNGDEVTVDFNYRDASGTSTDIGIAGTDAGTGWATWESGDPVDIVVDAGTLSFSVTFARFDLTTAPTLMYVEFDIDEGDANLAPTALLT